MSFNDEKKVIVFICDLYLNDIFIVEMIIECKYEESSICNDFFCWIYFVLNFYWVYGKYCFELKNEMEKKLEVNFYYFWDEVGVILEKDKVMVEYNEFYIIEKEDYIGEDVKEFEIILFVDFVME